jgi:hypothetical protein
VGIALASGGGGITAEAADAVIWPTIRPASPKPSRSAAHTLRIAATEHLAGLGFERNRDGIRGDGFPPAGRRRPPSGGIDVAVIVNDCELQAGRLAKVEVRPAPDGCIPR